MRLNPFLNAAIAAAYVWGVVLSIHFLSPPPNTPDTPITSIIALSLLVFSAAVMGFLFFYRPVVLIVEGKKEQATAYFLKTLGTFGAIALAVISTLTLLYR